jgi:hypothetical protein
MAKEDILSPRRYEFDLRHDGQLITKATLSSRGGAPTFTATAGATTATISTPTYVAADETIGNFVLRVIPTGDSDYSDTAFRAISSLAIGSNATVNLPFAMPKTFSAVACDLVYSEYLLPDTVREVVRASYEQEELSLEQLDPTVRFDEMYPTYNYDTGEPRVFSVGGFDTQTYSTLSSADPKLRAIVWPVPDNEYVLTYSYYYRHPDFEDGDSELVGVPPEVVNDIVFHAAGIMSMAWDGNFSAAHFTDMAQSMATAKHATYSGSSSRRHTIRSWDSGRSLLANREGFPGKLIGDV